ncbi:MAG: fibronectin type III domain-containing protein [Acidobacteria bacterium]|nr:MAG: fibronectin type III domain-containing protein [Acidobacteriota bacterium]REK01416.1 MAG: fibronectin type III domain-containing protein [Acidobacteriota bacterium]REK14372.1 MAG: fibronectin type III domain-containing protein [Acidobacteriota bacterium]REK45087.1 MAG: fibronectin type III domain-containing protein [Acidobacteriota bacterium]
MPARNAPDGSLLNISRADVYRLAEPVSASLTLTEEEFASKSTLIGSLPISDSDFALKQKTYTDQLQFAGQPVRLRYAVRFVNDEGQRAAFSNFLLIEPTSRVSAPPSGVTLEVAQAAVTVRWTEPATNVDGSTPANVLGYNVYRRNEEGAVRRLNTEGLVDANEFRDELFSFGESYEYFVRTVSLGNNAGQVESLDSEQISISPVDTFAPAPPDAVTIAASPTTISLFFAANVEIDIAGYRVYRSTDPNIDPTNWLLLTPDLLDSTTYQDRSVTQNVTYYYFVRAIDKNGNVSDPSEIVSDSAF